MGQREAELRTTQYLLVIVSDELYCYHGQTIYRYQSGKAFSSRPPILIDPAVSKQKPYLQPPSIELHEKVETLH